MACGGSPASIGTVHTETGADVSTQESPTIIAGCDGAHRGRQAVVLGRTLAGLSGARLLVVGVYPHPALPFPPPLGHRDDERRRTEEAVRAVPDELSPDARAVAVPGFSPAHASARWPSTSAPRP
jgi:hypothetical protein